MEKQKYRKYQSALMVAGQGLIMFCGWGILKLLLLLTVDKAYLYNDFGKYMEDEILRNVFYFILVFSFALSTIVQWKIGRKAMMVAKGERWKKSNYLMLAMLMIISCITIFSPSSYLWHSRIAERCCELIIEYVVLFFYISIIWSTKQVYTYRKEQASKESEGVQ